MQILPRSRKLRKCRTNLHYNKYVQKEQETLCVNMKLFETQKITIEMNIKSI